MVLQVPVGYHLLARMFGEVTYVPRSEYADRTAMFARHTARVQDLAGPVAKVSIFTWSISQSCPGHKLSTATCVSPTC